MNLYLVWPLILPSPNDVWSSAHISLGEGGSADSTVLQRNMQFMLRNAQSVYSKQNEIDCSHAAAVVHPGRAFMASSSKLPRSSACSCKRFTLTRTAVVTLLGGPSSFNNGTG